MLESKARRRHQKTACIDDSTAENHLNRPPLEIIYRQILNNTCRDDHFICGHSRARPSIDLQFDGCWTALDRQSPCRRSPPPSQRVQNYGDADWDLRRLIELLQFGRGIPPHHLAFAGVEQTHDPTLPADKERNSSEVQTLEARLKKLGNVLSRQQCVQARDLLLIDSSTADRFHVCHNIYRTG